MKEVMNNILTQFSSTIYKITLQMHTKVITMQPAAVSAFAFAPASASASASASANFPAPVPAPASRRSRSKPYRRSTRRRKNRTTAYFLASSNGRKAFDRYFAAGMDAAIAEGSAMDAAATRFQLPMKRRRIVSIATSAPPRLVRRLGSLQSRILL